MATTATHGNLNSFESAANRGATAHLRARVATGSPRRNRKVSPESGRAIEMLGHAIEYLADEFALDCMSAKQNCAGEKSPRIEAIEMLMARNREVYFACPEVPTYGERLRALLSLQRA